MYIELVDTAQPRRVICSHLIHSTRIESLLRLGPFLNCPVSTVPVSGMLCDKGVLVEHPRMQNESHTMATTPDR